ncbi:MAG: cation-translocating P-type ATPase [Fimbriimonadales bacterium]|nr:cation-translocating P-type ATPase [Fimbriimonadales bacterium]
MPTQRLKIKGMTCAACVRRVEQVLAHAPGVQRASVNLATEVAEIDATHPIDPEVLVEAVRKAGYDAEPLSPISEQPDAAVRALQRRLIISLLLTVPVVVMSMLLPDSLPHQGWILLALTAPVQFGVALPLYRAAWGALRHATANMEVLVLLGTLAAFGYSLALTLQGHSHHLYYETSAVIITLVLLGRTLEARARRRAQQALGALWSLLPHTVLRWNGTAYEPTPLEQVQRGDRLLVRTGERVPVDGIVLEGRGWVDESALTGESLPQERAAGDRVLSGALLTDGVLHLQAHAVGEQTLLAQIAQAVAHAQARKAAIQRVADQVAGLFVPVVAGIALLTLLGWYIATREFATALVPAVSVLVIACPCALGLAVPIAMLTGAARAARAGVLIRSFEALERVRTIDTLVLDKTGTLTLGKPKLARVLTDGVSEADALRLAAGLEQAVRHPLAEAILEAARAQGVAPAAIDAIEVVAGGGVKGVMPSPPSPLSRNAGEGERLPSPSSPLSCNAGEGERLPSPPSPLSRNAGEGEPDSPSPTRWERGSGGEGIIPSPTRWERGSSGVGLLLGSPRFLREQGVEIDKAWNAPVLLAIEGRVVAGFEFVDNPLPEVAATVDALRRAGLRLVLCSGDHPEAVAAFAQQVGIHEWHAAQLPQDKAALVRQLTTEGRRVAFVGDGINDAPALAEAQLGIAVATGTQLAAANADLLLLNRDLRTLLEALRIAHAIYRVIRQNLFFAFVYNILGIPLAALGYLNPMLAALAMSLSSVSVVANALRLLR